MKYESRIERGTCDAGRAQERGKAWGFIKSHRVRKDEFT